MQQIYTLVPKCDLNEFETKRTASEPTYFGLKIE